MALQLKHTISPVAADADPNTTEPTHDRVFQSEQVQGLSTAKGRRVVALLLDGTSVDFTLWGKLPAAGVGIHGTNTWIRLTMPRTAAALRAVVSDELPPGAELFVQITNVVGVPTRIGFALL